MALQGEGTTGKQAKRVVAGAVQAGGFGIVVHHFAVYLLYNSFALYRDVHSEPFAVLRLHFLDILYAVDAACAAPVGMGGVLLYLVALRRPAALQVAGLEVGTRVGTLVGR